MNTSVIFWGLLALVLVIIELFTLSIGFLLAAIAAVIVCVLVWWLPTMMILLSTQVMVFAGVSILLVFLLYRPLKFIIEKQSHKESYSNIIGTQATCEGPLQQGKEGKVRWSGTSCRAVLIHGTCSSGDVVTIVDVKGNIFMVEKKEIK